MKIPKLKIPFHPLLFQTSLAAGGVALMAFNYLQFNVPHEGALITLANVEWGALSAVDNALNLPLAAVMFAFTAVNFVLTAYFLKRLAGWLSEPGAYRTFVNNAPKNQNAGIFAIVASLAMTVNVFWSPFGFFVPPLASNLQAIMLPSLVIFGLLLAALVYLQVTVGRTWLSEGADFRQFNFIWLLDVFAFGLVALTGSGITAMAENDLISGLAAVGTLFTLVVGGLLLFMKLALLLFTHIRAAELPPNPILPGFFLVVPISCLFGLSAYRIAEYVQLPVSLNVPGSSSLLITGAYALAVGWGLAAVYVIREYLKTDFAKTGFAPSQWGFV